MAFRCDAQAQTLSIVSIRETSTHEGDGRVPAPPGFEQVALGNRETTCRLGNSVLAVGFLVSPPPERGACGGDTQNHLTKLSLNGKSLLNLPRYVNIDCLGYHPLHSVQVRRTSTGVEIETCEFDWDMAEVDSDPYLRCETVKVPEK
jgi:hypothetical protein